MSSPDAHRYSCCCLGGRTGACQPSARCADPACPCLEAGADRGLEFHPYAVRVVDASEGSSEVYDVLAADDLHARRQATDAFAGLKSAGRRARLQVEVLHGPTF